MNNKTYRPGNKMGELEKNIYEACKKALAEMTSKDKKILFSCWSKMKILVNPTFEK
jgi:hypothetical protein